MFPFSDPRGRNQPPTDSESGDDPMLRTSGKCSNTLCSSRQCDLLIIPKNRTFGTGLNFSGYCVYQDLRITSGLPVIRPKSAPRTRTPISHTVSVRCLLNLPHWLLERSSGGSQHHESSSEQKHELQAPGNQESCNREGDGGYSEGG